MNYLHDVYYVTDKNTNKFILGHTNDKLAYNIAANIEESLTKFTYMYKQCFLSKPTLFHYILKLMYKNKLLVGPIITNNFDGIPSQLGIKEEYIRRYDETHIIPDVNFHPNAKSLIVVGSHADRRKVQAAARKKSLKVIYIDLEGYFNESKFIPYQLESPKNEDLLYRESATNAFTKILDILIKNKMIIINGDEIPYECCND